MHESRDQFDQDRGNEAHQPSLDAQAEGVLGKRRALRHRLRSIFRGKRSRRPTANLLPVIIKVFAGFAGVMGIGAIAPILAITAVYALEVLVSFIQAYVFAILTCVYLKDALHPAH